MDEYVGVDKDGNRHFAGTGVHLLGSECPCHPVEVRITKTLVKNAKPAIRGYCHTGTAEYDIAQAKRSEYSVA